MSVESLFDLDRLCRTIERDSFKRVALQFPDEHLDKCAQIYQYMSNYLTSHDHTEIFIIGDSTFGSSIDDISAQHVDSDLLVYFGSDLTSSGTIPVIVAPIKKELDVSLVSKQLSAVYDDIVAKNDVALRLAVLLYDPCFAHHMEALRDLLQSHLHGMPLQLARLPACANLTAWDASESKALFSVNSGFGKLGGLIVTSELLSSSDTIVIYVGARQEQLTSISLQMSQNIMVSYNALDDTVCSFRGCDLREYRERTGGYLRVKDASIIGIIIGSMVSSKSAAIRIF